MNKLYNNIDEISTKLINYFDNINLPLSKPNKKLLSHIIFAMIDSQSVVTADISKSFKSASFSNNDSSNQKRLWRFFNNTNINIYDIYNTIINDVISRVSHLKHNQVLVSLDHMFTKNNFVTLMFTLRIDNQGIPIWFRTERTLSNCHLDIQMHSRKKLFKEQFIIDAIDDVINLLAPLNNKITFLADRWFFNLKILNHINKSGHYFCFRAKANCSVKALVYDKKEKHKVWLFLYQLTSQKHHSIYYKDLILGDMHFPCNLSISRDVANEGENWYIVSNINPNLAIKKYSKRFGSIEMFFKSQKTNGFYLESTKTKNLHAFETLYGVACLASLWLNIIATDYIKNYHYLKYKVNIKFVKKQKSGNKLRILSTFKLGLTLFKKVYSSFINYKLKFDFKLYL